VVPLKNIPSILESKCQTSGPMKNTQFNHYVSIAEMHRSAHSFKTRSGSNHYEQQNHFANSELLGTLLQYTFTIPLSNELRNRVLQSKKKFAFLIKRN
jgi:hypothetical protein